jgi:hypothetical protein
VGGKEDKRIRKERERKRRGRNGRGRADRSYSKRQFRLFNFFFGGSVASPAIPIPLFIVKLRRSLKTTITCHVTLLQ